MPVATEDLPSLDLGEPAQPLCLEELERSVKLREVLLDPGVGKLREVLGAKRLGHRPQLAHLLSPILSPIPNMCSTVPA